MSTSTLIATRAANTHRGTRPEQQVTTHTSGAYCALICLVYEVVDLLADIVTTALAYCEEESCKVRLRGEMKE